MTVISTSCTAVTLQTNKENISRDLPVILQSEKMQPTTETVQQLISFLISQSEIFITFYSRQEMFRLKSVTLAASLLIDVNHCVSLLYLRTWFLFCSYSCKYCLYIKFISVCLDFFLSLFSKLA